MQITAYMLFTDDSLPLDLGYAVHSLRHDPVVIRPFHNDDLIGPGVVRAIADCQTEWLAFVDSDDEIISGIFHDILAAVTPDTDMLYCNELVHNTVTGDIKPGWGGSSYEQELMASDPHIGMYWDKTNNRLSHHRGVFRTSACKDFVYDHSIPDVFAQGQLFAHVQAKRPGNIMHLDKVGYVWKIHGRNATLRYMRGKQPCP
jgi:hypothetical protein